MGYLRRPSYYKRFQCISSACTDSCCQGWEIDIDDETLAYYQQVKGDFGKRLADNIALPDPEVDEPAHFIQVEHERCPFLNQCNLCDIILTIGEEHISQICTHHPRYYDWLIDGQEAGLGLCCEAAAAFILEETGYPEFEVLEDGEPAEDLTDPDLQLEADLEQMLYHMREELFHLIKPVEKTPLETKISNLYRHAQILQDRYDDFLFFDTEDSNMDDSDTTDFDENDSIPSDDMALGSAWSDLFWNPAFLSDLLDFYLDLEINDKQWFDLLHELKKELPAILNRKEAFTAFYQDNYYEYEQLLIYFLYRYLLKAREDDCVMEKVHFALLSTDMIRLVDIYTWMKTGSLEPKQQIDVCKLYSKEIEYDEDNMEQVSCYLRG